MRITSVFLIGIFATVFALAGCSSASKHTNKHDAKVWQKQQSDKAHKELDKY